MSLPWARCCQRSWTGRCGLPGRSSGTSSWWIGPPGRWGSSPSRVSVPEFLDYFAVVEDGHSACGRAAQASAQAVIADVTADPGFAPRREIAAASGFRAVQSTPLVDHGGRLIGMVSTHFRRPHRPSSADLQVMELYGDYAGEALTEHFGDQAAAGGC